MEIGKGLQYRYLVFRKMRKAAGMQNCLPCNLEQCQTVCHKSTFHKVGAVTDTRHSDLIQFVKNKELSHADRNWRAILRGQRLCSASSSGGTLNSGSAVPRVKVGYLDCSRALSAVWLI